MIRTFLLAAAALAGVSASAQADTIIFNALGANGSNSIRSTGSAPIGLVTFSSTTTVSEIGVYDAMVSAGTQTFLIFNYNNGNPGNPLYQSAAKAFAGDGGTAVGLDSYKVSNPFSFTFQPGITYEIGATSSVTTGYYYSTSPVTQNGITVGADNDNVNGTTAQGVTQCCSTGIELFTSGAAPTNVPEPATLALLGGAMVGVGVVRRRVRRSEP